MNTIDSSLWLEYFADTEAGNIISEIIENLNELRLFQNFSFWKSYLRFSGKPVVRLVFPKPFPKLTEFWKWLN